MSTSLSTGRRFALLLAAAAMLFAMLPTAPADAGNGVAAVQGTATLDQGVGVANGTGSFSGTAVGAHVGGNTPGPVPVSATFTYSDVPIVTGTAFGDITIDGDTCGFNWTRVGVTAVVVFDSGCTGAAVAAFAPTSLPGSAPSTALVAGAGAWTH